MKNETKDFLIILSLSVFIIIILLLAQKAERIIPIDRTSVLFFIPPLSSLIQGSCGFRE